MAFKKTYPDRPVTHGVRHAGRENLGLEIKALLKANSAASELAK